MLGKLLRILSHHRFLYLIGGCISILLTGGIFRQHVTVIRQVNNGIEELIMPSNLHSNGYDGHTIRTTTRRTIFSRLRKDQSGWVIFDMLKAHAYAFSQNATYGGACGDSIHKEDVQQVLTAVGWDKILPLNCPSDHNDTTISSSRVYPSNYFEPKHGRRMGADAWRNFMKDHTDYSYFVGKQRQQQQNDPSTTMDTTIRQRNNNLRGKSDDDEQKSPSLFSIVVHIRRRDVTPCCYPDWYLPNSYFSSMIEKYRRMHQDKQNGTIHIFSQSQSHESWDDFTSTRTTTTNSKNRNNTTTTTTDNNSTKNDYNLHLDGPVGEVWRAILSADVFIGSISEFSRVPALFARGEIPDPRNIADVDIANQTAIDSERLLDQCTEMQLLQCKNKWWMKKKKKEGA